MHEPDQWSSTSIIILYYNIEEKLEWPKIILEVDDQALKWNP